ncbi:MAG: YIP1 family protein, partial [Anaerolineae bacterium]
RAVDAVVEDPQGPWSGLWLGILFLTAYALTVLIYYLLGHQPVAEPFLPIPLERWYLVQAFTTLPVGMAAFLSYAGVAYLVCRAWGGRGSWDATLGASLYGLVLPWVFFTLSFELLVAPFLIAAGIRTLPWPQWIEILRVFVLPIAWMLGLCVLALVRVHRVSWWKSLAAVVAATIPFAGIMAVFIR